MKVFKLYLIALFFSITWWAANKILGIYVFSVPVYLKVNFDNEEIRFFKDTIVQLDFTAKGYEWLRMLFSDTLYIHIKGDGMAWQKQQDLLFVKINSTLLQKKIDSLFGKGFSLTSNSTITLRDTFYLRKKIRLILPVVYHQVKGCFLCGQPAIEPAYIYVEGKPSIVEHLDSIWLRIDFSNELSCQSTVKRITLPLLYGVRYVKSNQSYVLATFPFCMYRYFSIERLYRFEYEQKTYEGTVQIEGYAPPYYLLDSIKVVVNISDNRHALFGLNNPSLFKEVVFNPAQIELK
ncbi:MAG: hypothetical protein N2Z72_04760 [Bacteroidales bacterium]|nr:hypothetical protein [Bacteroidales bacterium]